MVSEAIKRRFEKVASRGMERSNWTLADLCANEDERIPAHIEDALKELMGEKKRSKTQPGKRARGKFSEPQTAQRGDA